jgi:single-strand DNA-binding protein
LVELSGRLSSRAWIGKDGEIKSGLNFHTSQIKLHSSGKKSDTGEKQPNETPQGTNAFADETEDDLLF